MKSVLFDTLAAENGAQIGIATLNVEKALNALNLEMIELLFEQLTAWQQDENIAMVLLQGAGEKAFCAGGDIVSLYNAMKDNTPKDYIKTFFTREYRLDYLIHSYAKPICVWGNGIIMGGGLGLMAGASHRVVTESSRIAMPEVSIGLYPDVGGSYFLNKMPDQVGLFLGLTGASVNALDALYVGLADTVIEHQLKDKFLTEIVKQDWQKEPDNNHQVLSQLLTELNRQSSIDLVANIESNNTLFEQMKSQTSLDGKAQVILSIETEDKWLKRAVNGLKHGSPISAHLVYQQLEKSRDLSLADCYKMELGMSVYCGEFGEFQEGVRALLIDKDYQPNWRYKSISETEHEVIEQFFNYDFGSEHPLADL